ncbi:MAG: ABC transporter permease [Clostridiales bacterium]|nr:ABC transporter permease [Clostridiales bacterium]
MRDPLNRRLPREMRKEWKKYVVLVLLMTFMIAIASGIFVANKSMLQAIDESYEKYNIEHGHFILKTEGSEALLQKMEEECGIRIYKQYYKEVAEVSDASEEAGEDDTIRVFRMRNEVNKISLIEGALPENPGEIVIDRMHADNRSIKIGDTIGVDGISMRVTGVIAASDYTSLFPKNSDLMFNAINFDIGFVSDADWDMLVGSRKFEYAYQFTDAPGSDKEQKERSDVLMEKLAVLAATGGYTSDLATAKALEADMLTAMNGGDMQVFALMNEYKADMNEIMDFVPEYQNQAIRFAGDDLSDDEVMMEVLVYIFIGVIAFVFAITTNNTIVNEAAVIGTLRSTGYTRRELLFHYIKVPFLVTIIAAVLGNILGYTIFKDFMVSMYYNTYSLLKFETVWNANAFVKTTLIPLILMAVINFIVIYRKLRLSPLKFLRRDLSTSKRKKAMRLPRVSFLNRFRMRIFLQNIGGYIVLFFGIAFVMLLLAFAIGLPETVDHFKSEMAENMLSDYQYILKETTDEDGNEITTSEESAEKFSMASLQTTSGVHVGEDIGIYGISKGSRFVSGTDGLTGNEVLVSSAYKKKFGLRNGDVLTLKDKYSDDTYDFVVKGEYDYMGSLSIFMTNEGFNQVFGKEEGSFMGYMAQREITDIETDRIYSVITVNDILSMANQLDHSMGSMCDYLAFGSGVIALLVIFLLTKLIIEKNAVSISMVKVLGYENREINSLYVRLTTIVVVIFAILSALLSVFGLTFVFAIMMYSMNGWFDVYISATGIVKMIVIMVMSYLVVALFDMHRIKKIPMADALKNVE